MKPQENKGLFMEMLGSLPKIVFCIPVRKPVPDAFVPSWQAPETERLAFTPAEMAKQKHAIRRPDVKAVNNVKIGD